MHRFWKGTCKSIAGCFLLGKGASLSSHEKSCEFLSEHLGPDTWKGKGIMAFSPRHLYMRKSSTSMETFQGAPRQWPESTTEAMDRSGFPLSSAHRAREQDTCTSTPNDILHDSAARANYMRTHDRVCPTTIIAVIGQNGWTRRVWLTGRIGPLPLLPSWRINPGCVFTFVFCYQDIELYYKN